MTIRARRFAVAGVLAVAAPLGALLTIGAGQAVAAPACLSWYGNQEDGICLSYSNGQGYNIGTPNYGTYGPQGQFGVSTGPLAPGQTWTRPIG